jgi:cell division protein FtsI (penicillin-binding protein 3)
MKPTQVIKAKTQTAVRFPVWRRYVLLFLLLAGMSVLVGRALYLQMVNRSFYQKQGEARYTRSIILKAHRGVIRDRNGESMAISTAVAAIWANPADTKMSNEQKQQLLNLLKISADELNKKLSIPNREFVYLKRRISPEAANQILALGIPGIHSEQEYRRYYPDGEVAAHLVGFTDLNEKGQEGIELKYQAKLAGKQGRLHVLKDRADHIVEELDGVVMPQNGKDVVLSIDKKIQYIAYRELAAAVEKHHAQAGSAIVLDAKSGEILAMVNLPSYNPNNPSNVMGKTRNRAITDTFEPGSTMKPVAVAIGLESGKFRPETQLDTSPGIYKIGPATIHDTHNYGVLTVAGVVQKSSNVGATKIVLSLEPQYMWSKLSQMGFGALTRIEFPGEVSGRLRNYKTWRPIEQATMSYGNGISVTLLQLARAYTIFANDGELRPVTLLKNKEVQVGQQVISPENARSVRDMLETVVQPGGTAVKAQVMGYRVAGKTGTAHKPGVGGYQNKYISSFVGMAPASNPKLIVAVMIDEPNSGQYYGGAVAAPVFSAVMGATLRMMGVPQDAPNDNIIMPSADNLEVKESL